MGPYVQEMLFGRAAEGFFPSLFFLTSTQRTTEKAFPFLPLLRFSTGSKEEAAFFDYQSLS